MAQTKMNKTKMGKWSFSQEELNRRFAQANRLGNEALQTDPRSKSVSYDGQHRRLVFEMLDGTLLGIPVDYIQGIAEAPDHEIATVTLSQLGDSVHWPNLDLEFSVAGLAANRFGTRAWMAELGRKGGRVTSLAKAAAAKVNGQKGGRPRKERLLGIPNIERFQAVPLKQDAEFLDADLSDQSHMATEAVVKYEHMVVAAYQTLTRNLQAAQTKLIASILASAEPTNLKASIKLPDSRIQDWAEGLQDAELPIAA